MIKNCGSPLISRLRIILNKKKTVFFFDKFFPQWLFPQTDVFSFKCHLCDALRDFALACNFTKSNFPLLVFFTFFKLYKWYQIAQRISHNNLMYKFIVNKVFKYNFQLAKYFLLVKKKYTIHSLAFNP